MKALLLLFRNLDSDCLIFESRCLSLQVFSLHMQYDDNTTNMAANPIQMIIIFLAIIISNVTRFESGNLEKAVRITDTYYELYLRCILNAKSNICSVFIHSE